jgi:hypothetical protein
MPQLMKQTSHDFNDEARMTNDESITSHHPVLLIGHPERSAAESKNPATLT